jgi:GTPase SAR1 family protein
MSSFSKKDENKIIVLGLAESGKSTIINAVTVGTIPERGARYSATMNYERKSTTVLGKQLTIFDLGGQTSFLDRFTGELAEFVFSGVKAFIFVVDSSKFEEISRAKYYLDLCLQNLDQFSPNAIKYMFLHKVDLVKKSMLEEVAQNMKEFLISDYPGKIKHYTTSIFSENLFTLMGDIYAKISKSETALEPLIDNFFRNNANIISVGQIFTKQGSPVPNIKSLPFSDDFDIDQLLKTAETLGYHFTRTTNDPAESFMVETRDKLFILKLTTNGLRIIVGFLKEKMIENKESNSSLFTKVNTFSHQLSKTKLN